MKQDKFVEEEIKMDELLTIQRNYNEGYLRYRVYPDLHGEYEDVYDEHGMFPADLLHVLEEPMDVVYMVEVYVNDHERHKGHGTQMINDLVEKFDDHLIVTRTAAFMSEYDEKPSDKEIYTIIEKLHPFMTSCNFEDVSPVGDYETMNTYVYKNEIGLNFYDKVVELYSEE